MKLAALVVKLALGAVVAMTHPGLFGAQDEALDIPNLEGKILTVKGPIDPADAGMTLMHEHIHLKFKTPTTAAGEWADQTEEQTKKSKAAMEKAPTDWVDKGVDPPWAKNFPKGWNTLDNYELQLSEINEFKKAGGGTMVDVAAFGLGRNPAFLVKLSEASNLNIVVGSSWYAKHFHPRDMSVRTVEELTDILVQDITVGCQKTKVRSGIIGEIGFEGNPVTKDEIKVVRACARASRMTGAPMTFHFMGNSVDDRLKALDLVKEEGADLNHVVMGHTGIGDAATLKKYTDRGAYVEFDFMGWGADSLKSSAVNAIAQNIATCIKAGLTDRILISQDVCTTYQQKKSGGGGYVYVTNYIIPALKAKGINEETIKKIMVDNPRRVLTFTAPKP